MVGWYGKPIGLLFVLDQLYLIYTKLGASFFLQTNNENTHQSDRSCYCDLNTKLS